MSRFTHFSFERLDYFGKSVPILLNGYSIHKTNFGSFLTLCIMIVLIIRASYLFYQITQGADPTVLYQERQVVNPKRFDINPRTFNIALTMYDSNYNYVLDGMLKFDSYLETKIPVENNQTKKIEYKWTKIPFQLERCTEDHIQIEQSKEYFLTTNLAQHLCLPKDISLHVEGEFNADQFAAITIDIVKCQGSNCKGDSLINDIAKLFFVEVQFSDVYFSPENKNNPFSFYGRDIFWENSLKFPKIVYMNLRNNYVESDFGFFKSDIKTDIYPSFSFVDEKVSEFSEGTYSKLVIRFEKKKENYYKRFYQKGVSIISEIGGLSSVLTVVGILLTTLYNKIDLNQKLINQTFSFQELKEQGSPSSQSQNIEMKNKKNTTNKTKLSNDSDKNNVNHKKNKKINYIKSDIVNTIDSRNQMLNNANTPIIIDSNDNLASFKDQKTLNDKSQKFNSPSKCKNFEKIYLIHLKISYVL